MAREASQSCGLPTGGLVEKAFVPHDGIVTGLPHRARQQFFNVVQHAVAFGGSRIAYFTPCSPSVL
jgi:hypothetical protein